MPTFKKVKEEERPVNEIKIRSDAIFKADNLKYLNLMSAEELMLVLCKKKCDTTTSSQ